MLEANPKVFVETMNSNNQTFRELPRTQIQIKFSELKSGKHSAFNENSNYLASCKASDFDGEGNTQANSNPMHLEDQSLLSTKN